MIIEVHYIVPNITQYLTVVEQLLYDSFKKLQSIVPLETDPKTSKIVMEWDKLPVEQQQETKKQCVELKWIGKLKKNGKICTSESPIYHSFLRGDGVLTLPKHQGGDHPVRITEFTKEVNEFINE